MDHPAHLLPNEQLRAWRLAKLTGRLPSELGDVPAHELDWLLAVDDTVAKAEETRRNRQG